MGGLLGISPRARRPRFTALLHIEPVDHLNLQHALTLVCDFEDVVQPVTAAQCQADQFITRNPRDFKQSLVPVMTPAKLLALLA